jgi:hypothetical protein
MDDSAWGEVIAAGVLLLVTGALLGVYRWVYVATRDVTYTLASGVQRTVTQGMLIPAQDVALVQGETAYRRLRRSALRGILIGQDNRTSTSKVVAFAWTYAIAFGLLAIVFADWLGDTSGYAALINNGLQEAYLLFLGGTYAAAVIAKFKTSSDAQGETGKPAASAAGGANLKQLVANDQGDGDLGDFQYVLFNLIALIWFLGTFIPHLSDGFPIIPDLLTGLALTSAGGYSAKKLVAQSAPRLASIHPPSALASTDQDQSLIEVWGRNLIVNDDTGKDLTPPTVSVGGLTAKVTTVSQPLGVDHVTVEVPKGLDAGPVRVSALRSDGTLARGPDGTDGLTLTITAPKDAPA